MNGAYQQINPEPMQPTAEPPRQGGGSGWMAWVVGIFMVILVGGGLYYYYQYIKIPELNTKIDNLQSQVDELNKNKESSTSTDATADWKTYTNTVYNYSIKYPNDWNAQAYNVDQKENATPTTERLQLVKDNTAYVQIYKISQKTIEIAASYFESTVISDQDVEANMVSGTIKVGQQGAGEKVTYIIEQSGSNVFVINISREGKYQELKSTIDNIILSFGLTD